MKRAVALAITGLIGITIVYTTTIATRWLRVSRLRIAVPGLPSEWAGTRIAHLSDLHLAPGRVSTELLYQAKSVALDFQPDIVALTGDYFDDGAYGSTDDILREWGDGAPVFAVMGNHDRRGTPGTLDRIKDELRAGGVTILDNEARTFNLRGIDAWVAGVDDPHTYNSDVRRALSGVPDGERVLLFLSHSPDAIRKIPDGKVDLLLCGHTHGGQIRLLPSGAVPLVGVIRRLRGAMPRPDGPVYRRWHRINGTPVVVSDGLGVSTIPMRFRTRPHVVLIELQRAVESVDRSCDDVERYVEEVDPEHPLVAWLT